MKEYIAIVEGTPRPLSGTITLPLAHDPADRRRIIVADGGMPAVTRYRVASSDGVHSLVQCELVTGRTHQIRVHLAARGWPVAGDRVYGHASATIERQALHAWRVSLPHPVSRTALHMEAPMPRDMRALLRIPDPGSRVPDP
jgi:23S rRNA pseudouridine1911/1915/1917 synthase